MMEAFERLGHGVDSITLEMHEKSPSGEQILKEFKKAFERSSYDAVISINYFPVVSLLCQKLGILYISWTVDEPVLELLSETLSNDVNRIFCFDMEQCRKFSAFNPHGTFYLPLATNTDRWDSVIQGTKDRSHECEISFVGSLYTEKCPYDNMKNPPEYLKGYLEGIMNAQKNIYGAFILEESLTDKVVNDFIRHTPGFWDPGSSFRKDDAYVMASAYLGMKVTSMERLEVIRRLGQKHGFDIYTGSDTKGLPVHNRGFAKTLTQMPLIFNQSKINLNITCRSIRTGLSQRIWDVMGAGGFLITNFQNELPEFFTIGEDLEIYSGMEELEDKVNYYLAHEEERKKIALSGYEKTKEHHTWKNRIRDMLNMLGF